MDIGGGTSNLALVESGHVTQTGCLNVGGRLIKIAGGVVQYVSPVLKSLCSLTPGQRATEADLAPVVERLVQTLEIAGRVGGRERFPPTCSPIGAFPCRRGRSPCPSLAVWRI